MRFRKSTIYAVLLCASLQVNAAEQNCIFENAHWIGGSTRPFHAMYFPVFRLAFSLQINDNANRASIIYGANDWRLTDSRRNIYGLAAAHNSSFIEVEFANDSIRFYRNGYKPADKAGVAIATLPLPPGLDWHKKHDVVIASESGTTNVTIDNVGLGRVELNPIGRGGDYTAFPVVGDVGYRAVGGACISDFRIENFRAPHNRLASADINNVEGFRIFPMENTGTTRLRTTFRIDRKIASATLSVTSRGIYDFYVNGKLVNNQRLLPGLSQYNKTHNYLTFDITRLLREGDNAAGATLSEGWWSGANTFIPGNWNAFGDRQSLVCRMEIKYTDGTSRIIVSTPDMWKTDDNGPVRYGSLFQGEIYDARCAGTDWTQPHYNDSQWQQATEVALTETATQNAETYNFSLLKFKEYSGGVNVYETLTAQSVNEVTDGRFVYDLAQNHAGVPSITFRGLSKGDTIWIRFSETMYPRLAKYGALQGTPLYENLRAAMAQDIYIANGDSIETFEPRTTFHGYRYIEINGAMPATDDVRSRVLSSVDRFTSHFECSDPLINQLVSNIKYSTLSNVFSIPTDCPQRNERLGWSGDLSVFVNSMTFLFNAQPFLANHLQALHDTKGDDWKYPPVAPVGGGFGGPLWESVGITVPWELYLKYADTTAIVNNYADMTRYLVNVLENYIDPNDGHFKGTETWSDLGDWLGPQCDQNDKTLLFDSYLCYELDIMQRMAKVIGKHADAKYFAKERDKRRKFIKQSYMSDGVLKGCGFGPASSSWSGKLGGQAAGKDIKAHTSYAVPLALGVFDTKDSRILSEQLHKLTNSPATDDNGATYPPFSLMTGFVGTPWILHALTDGGHVADAYSILLNSTYPSWLYPVTMGATTVWERLNSLTADEGFGKNNSMNSFNHYAFGCVYDWLMQTVAGICADPEAPGFKHFYLKPQPDPTGRLTHAKACYESINGRIESSWVIENGKTTYHFTIPENTKATLILPNMRKVLAPGQYTFMAEGE